MAFKKNKKRFDPRYFMDEKTEELKTIEEGRSKLPVPPCAPKRLPAPAYDPAEQAQWERRRKEEEEEEERNINNNVGRYGQIPEGIENITPENIEIVAQAVRQIGYNFAGPVLIGALGMTLQNAIEYLKGKEAPSAPPQEDQELEETQAALAIDIERGKAMPAGSYDEAAKRLYALVGTQQMQDALWAIKGNFPNLGDVKRLEAYSEAEWADDKFKNAVKILSVLGNTVNEWCPKCNINKQATKIPKNSADVPSPGQLQERRRRQRKIRSK